MWRRADAATIGAYVESYRSYPDRTAALDRLTLETWLLSRRRRLHAACRADDGRTTVGVTKHLRDWASLTEQTFLATRRVQRGRPEPGGLLDRLAALLTADAAVFDDDPVRITVVRTVAGVLGVPAAELTEPLTELPSFSSFRVVEVIEQLERELNVELDADDLVPENLHDIAGLIRVVHRARPLTRTAPEGAR